jgi:hypothetical protein
MPDCIPGDSESRIKLADGPCCGDCSYSLAFDAKIFSDEYRSSWNPQWLMDVGELYVYPAETVDHRLVWRLGTYIDEVEIDSGHTVASPGDFFDAWHSYQLTMSYDDDDDTWYAMLTVDSLSSSSLAMDDTPWYYANGNSFNPTRVTLEFLGASVVATSRRFRNIAVNLASEVYTLPDDGWDTTSGYTESSGEVVLARFGYALKQLWADRLVCCFRDATEISSLTLAMSYSVSAESDISCGLGCDDVHCVVNDSGSASRAAYRINLTDNFDLVDLDNFQFKLYCGYQLYDDRTSKSPHECHLKLSHNHFTVFLRNSSDRVGETHSGGEGCTPLCSGEGCAPVGSCLTRQNAVGSTVGDFFPERPSSPGAAQMITLRVGDAAGSSLCSLFCDDELRNHYCSANASLASDNQDIVWADSCNDLSGLRGVHSASDDTDDGTVTASITIA